MKKVFISQSNYIPWKGYFDAINSVDEFIIYDDAQYTKNDWRNRNKIKSPGGSTWLTIPVQIKGKHLQKIKEAKVCETNWASKHWRSLMFNYSKTPYFREYASALEDLYLNKKYIYLKEVNYSFIKFICKEMEIRTPIKYSMDFQIQGRNKNERLLNLCKAAGATDYYTGPSAKNYLNEELFKSENINIHYLEYDENCEYAQHFGPFLPNLSIIDLLFNEGKNAKNYLRDLYREPICELK